MKKREAWQLEGEELKAYRQGFHDGDQGDYFPGGLNRACYDWGHRDGEQHGDRKGKPWTQTELNKLMR